MQNENKKGIGYIRVSSKAQVDEGVSLEVQEKEVTKLLQDYNCSSIKIFSDRGKSARTVEGRDAFVEGVNYAIDNKATFFAVYDTSRFARNVEDSLKYYSLLKQHNVQLLCVTAKFEDTPEGRLVFSLMSSIDEYQSNKSGEKIAMSMKELHKQGKFPHTAPVGYQNIRKPDGRADIIIHPQYGELVQNALKKYATGEFDTEKEVAEYLWKGGLTHQWKKLKGAKYKPQTVSRILNKRFYSGYFWDKGNEIWRKHTYPTLISEEEYETIQSRLKKRNRNNQENHYKLLREEFPLRTNMYCPRCGGKYHGYKTKGNGGYYYYYDCKTKGCSGAIEASKVHKVFQEYIETISPSESVLKLFREILKRQLSASEKQFEKETENISRKLTELEKEKDSIKQGMLKTNSDDFRNELEKDYERISKDISKLKSERDTPSLSPDNVEPIIEEGVEYLQKPFELWSFADIKHKNLLQQWMFPEGFQYFPNEGCRTNELCLTYSIMNELNSSNIKVVETTGIEPMSKSVV
ncbi:MAG: recombinase family protein [Candidatus Dojkabacteria bacterium]